MKKVEIIVRLFIRGGYCWDLSRITNPTSARHGDGLKYIRIRVTPSRMLVFWDGTPSSFTYKLENIVIVTHIVVNDEIYR